MSTLLAPGPHTFTLKGTKVVPDRAGQGSLTMTYVATLTLERIP
jgi:hypothetical protein